MNESVLVTGGCGFIGTRVCLLLLENEYDVTVCDNFSTTGPEQLIQACEEEGFSPPDIREIDVRNYDKLSNQFNDVDFVVHLAAYTNVPRSTKKPTMDFETNTQGTFNVLRACKESTNIEKIVFASSNAAVGEVEGAVDESCVPEPIAPYGTSKLYGESLCSSFSRNYDFQAVALRFANAYGPYSSHKTSVIPKFIRRAKQEKPLEIYGDGEQTRDFIHSEDIARAIKEVMETNFESPYELFQVATGIETKIKDLAEMISNLASEKDLDVPVVHGDPRPGEIRFNYSSIDKLTKLTQWKPDNKLRKGVKRIFENSEP